MKIVCVSDLQAHQWASYPERDSRGVNLRLLDTVRELKRLHTLCLRNGVKMIACLGDVFQARSAIDISVLNAIYESFYAFHESGIRVVILVGNHDLCSLGGSRDHALKVFKAFADIIDKPTTIPIEHGNLVGIPYHPNASAIRKAIQKYVNSDTRLLLLHCAIQSVRLPSGQVWGEGIALSDIPRETTALLGHFHRWSELRPGKVWYVGSMTPVDWGDTSVDKYFCVFNSKSGSVQFHHTKAPEFITLDLSLKPDTLQTPTRRLVPADLDIEKYLAVIPGNFLKVKRVPQGFTDFSGLQTVLKSLGARHVALDIDAVVTALPQGAEEAKEWSTMPVTEMLEEYVTQTPHNLDSALLVDTGTAIVEEIRGEKVTETVVEQDDPLEVLTETELQGLTEDVQDELDAEKYEQQLISRLSNPPETETPVYYADYAQQLEDARIDLEPLDEYEDNPDLIPDEELTP